MADKRLIVNINEQTEAAILDYCLLHGVTATEAIRQMIGTAYYLVTAAQEGKTIHVGSTQLDVLAGSPDV